MLLYKYEVCLLLTVKLFTTMSSIKLIFSLVLLGSAFSRNVETAVPILPSGFYEGLGVPIQYPNGNIVGGIEATPHEFPWQALLNTRIGDKIYICGGVIIANDYILTAAHCTYRKVSIEVVMGVHDRNADEISQVRRTVAPDSWMEHENYRKSNLENDIALIKLDPPINFNDQISAINLNQVEPPNKTKVTLTGWGRTGTEETSNVLLKVDVVIANDRLCKRSFGDGLPNMEGVICVKTNQTDTNSSPCNGDSGGPMNYDGPDGMVLNGISSFVAYVGCDKERPAGYTSVPYHYDWIIKNTAIIF